MLYQIRVAELKKDRAALEHAATDAVLITRFHNDWPWAWYALSHALAALELGGWQPLKPVDGVLQGESYADASFRHLHASLERDPDFVVARRWFIAQLVSGGDRLLLPSELPVMEREVARPAPDADALLIWARHLRTLRLYDSALATFNRAATLGGDRSRLALERARTLRALHDSTGATVAYWDGATHLTPTGRELYRFDLAWIVDADSLASFDKVPDGDVAAWLRRFWEERDVLSTREAGSRLNEHLRRWALAYTRYRTRSPWRRTMRNRIDMFFDNDECLHMDLSIYQMMWRLPPTHAGDVRYREWLLDQRGLLYLRHGEPIERIGGRGAALGRADFTSGPSAYTPDQTSVWSPWDKGQPATMLGNGPSMAMDRWTNDLIPKQMAPRVTESWLYLIEGNLRLLHFRDSYAVGMYDATTLSGFLPYVEGGNSVVDQGWVKRTGRIPAYHAAGERIASEARFKPRAQNPPTCWNQILAADNRSRSDVRVAGQNDSDSPPLLNPWQFVIHMFGLGTADNGSGKALVTFALSGDSLHSTTLPDGRALYEIRFRASGWNSTTAQRLVVDTTRRFVRPAPLAAGERLVATLEMPLSAGSWQLAVRARQESDSSGAYATHRDLQIVAGTSLSLSDIVTGLSGSAPWRATDGSPFPINMLDSWPTGSAVELYFEVHGVPASQPFRTSITVEPRNVKNARTIQIAATDRSSGLLTPIRRSLALERLIPGEYLVTVTIEANGQRVSRQTPLTVAPR